MKQNDYDAIHGEFERAGESAVRMNITKNVYNGDMQTMAIKWLAEREAQAERRREDSHSVQASAALRAAIADERAAAAAESQALTAKQALTTARIAAATAAVALIVSIAVALHVFR